MSDSVRLAVMDRLHASLSPLNTTILDTWFPITQLESYTFVGTFAWTSKAAKSRWVHKKYAHNIDDLVCTPGDLARNWLAVTQTKRLRCNTPQYREMQIHRQSPMLAIPGALDDAIYVDLVSAYWQIMQRGGWDVDYMPGRYVGIKSGMESFPWPHIKLARNCLVTAGRSGSIMIWTGDKLITQKKPNRFINNVLWMFVQDVLNGIADDMRIAGAQYIHTDGYIIDRRREHLVKEVMQSWGMHWKVKNEGAAIVYGAATYDIGTRKHKKLRIIPTKPIANINPVEKEWLRKKMRWIAENRGFV